MRALLNFGHTFGHAIEAGAGYGAWLHGEAVAAGMVMAAELSMRAGPDREREVARVRELIAARRLAGAGPGACPGAPDRADGGRQEGGAGQGALRRCSRRSAAPRCAADWTSALRSAKPLSLQLQ